MNKSKPATQRLTWAERLQRSKPSVVKIAPINIAGMKAGQIMLVPSAADVDAFVRRIPCGQSMSAQQLRQRMAKAHKAEVTCPITTGFHLKTVAEAAFEAHHAGAALTKITPFWRVIGSDSPTLKKLSFNSAFVLELRQLEGLPI
jgi:hypothetical protein